MPSLKRKLLSVVLLLVALASPMGFLFWYGYQQWHGFLAEAENATCVVKAIYRYHDTMGLWPQQLADLPPALLAKPIPQGWYLIWYGYDESPLLVRHGPPHLTTAYEFPGQPGQVGWHASCEGSLVELNVAQPIPEASTLSPEEKARRCKEELQRRTQTEPGNEQHQQELKRVFPQ